MPNVHIDDGLRAIIRETARETAEEVLRQHRADCAINDVKSTVYGNHSPGLKIVVDRHERELKELANRRSGRAAVITGAAAIVLGGLIELGIERMFNRPAAAATPASHPVATKEAKP